MLRDLALQKVKNKDFLIHINHQIFLVKVRMGQGFFFHIVVDTESNDIRYFHTQKKALQEIQDLVG